MLLEHKVPQLMEAQRLRKQTAVVSDEISGKVAALKMNVADSVITSGGHVTNGDGHVTNGDGVYVNGDS